MVLQIILADILLIARSFPRPCGDRKNTTQLIKYPRVLSVNPSNKVYCIVSYRIVSYRIVSYRIVSYCILLYSSVHDSYGLHAIRRFFFSSESREKSGEKKK